MHSTTRQKPSQDIVWAIVWCLTMSAVALWDLLFLNKPACIKIVTAFSNTLFIALAVILFTLVLSLLVTNLLCFTERKNLTALRIGITFLLNVFRSIPQVVGVLFGYISIGILITTGAINSSLLAFCLMAAILSLFIFLELVDLMRDRIDHFRKLDFFPAMLFCGIKEERIINIDILWKNSRVHIFNKCISIFGMAIFLQCSVDFVISVGLSTAVSSVNLPVTLGSLLADIDSKQDVLAIGYALFHPENIGSLFSQHLQGITVAFVLVFTLLSLYHIANGFTRRHRL